VLELMTESVHVCEEGEGCVCVCVCGGGGEEYRAITNTHMRTHTYQRGFPGTIVAIRHCNVIAIETVFWNTRIHLQNVDPVSIQDIGFWMRVRVHFTCVRVCA
jgi:hypothetical protein